MRNQAPAKEAMAKFYLDKRHYADKAARWVSFESTPSLEETKRDIYGKCVPCISNLYEQLQAGKTDVNLGPAYNCWKIVAVLANDDECVQVLAEFEREFLGERTIKGRFGSGDVAKSTKVIVFSAPQEEEKDTLFEQVGTCARRINPAARVSFHRGCAELYHELFGDWMSWRQTETIKTPEAVKEILARIRKMLFWEKE
jgi:hypothetical protein